MKKIMSYILAVIMFTNTAIAAESFFSVDVQPGPYYVYGVKADKDKKENPACYAEVNWRDGSKIQFIRDLADGELYIYFQNVSWNILDAPGKYILRANFHYSNGDVRGLNYHYDLINKNTIVIRNMIKEEFVKLFTSGNRLVFVMPGSIKNAEVDLTGSTKALQEISNCIDKASGIDLYPDGQMNNNQSKPEIRI